MSKKQFSLNCGSCAVAIQSIKKETIDNEFEKFFTNPIEKHEKTCREMQEPENEEPYSYREYVRRRQLCSQNYGVRTKQEARRLSTADTRALESMPPEKVSVLKAKVDERLLNFIRNKQKKGEVTHIIRTFTHPFQAISEYN